MSIGRFCTRNVDLAEGDETAVVAADRMQQRGVGCLVILNKERRPIGLLTDRDLAMRVVAADRDPGQTLVGEIMTRDVRVVSETTPLEEALTIFRGAVVRRLPVVDDDGRLVGLVSVDDILLLLAGEIRMVGDLLERETPEGLAGS